MNYYQNYPYFAFYFLVPGQSETITLYGIDPLGSPQQASVSFTVDGPTNVTTLASGGTGIDIVPPPTSIPGVSASTLPWVGDGIPVGDTVCTGCPKWVASVTPPSGAAGTYQWVQVLTTDQGAYVTGSSVLPAQNLAPGATPSTPMLDTQYPYPYMKTTTYPNDTAIDDPGSTLQLYTGEVTRLFMAKMYLMWIPPVSTLCTSYQAGSSAGCVMPVSLGYNTWGLSYDVINTLQVSTNDEITYDNWVFNPSGCSKQTPSVWTASTQYPSWSGIGK